MIQRVIIFLIILGWLAPCAGFPGMPWTVFAGDLTEPDGAQNPSLEDCYRFALRQSEKIAVQKTLIDQAEGQFRQSLSTILPSASFSYSQEYRDDGRSDSLSSPVPESKFLFSQSLFSGFREFAAMASSRALERQRKFEKMRAEQLLFMDVADAFYLFLTFQEDLQALMTTREALKERVDELKKRVDLGRSRPSEVAGAQSRLSRVEADLELVDSQLEVARQLLEFLVGRQVASVDDVEKFPMPFSAEEDFLNRSESRPDVRAAKAAWDSNKGAVDVARADYWPQASLDGNLYTKREGSSENEDWDVTFSVEVPIFTGGETSGKVRESAAKSEQARLVYEESKRKAALEIRNAFTRWQSDLRRKTSLEKALNASEKNYALQKEDYTLSLVSNLDVLEALEELQSTRREFIIAKSEARRSYYRLEISAGILPITPAPN